MSTRPILRLAPLAVLLLLAAACSSNSTSASTASSARTVKVTMRDLSFSPSTFTAKAGETVTFSFHNEGKVTHEALIGTDAQQEAHEGSMSSSASGSGGDMGGMGGMSTKPHGSMDASHTEAVVVAPGKTGTLTYRFDQAGTLVIGCHQPGHYQSGMKATVSVS